jgi:hypothetical protein
MESVTVVDGEATKSAEPSGVMNEALFYQLVEAAIAAPSAENRHHIRFRRCSDSIEIIPDDTFLTDAPARHALYQMAVGAMVENIVITLAAEGSGASVQWHELADDRPVATVTIAERAGDLAATAALQAFIAQRCTNRTLRYSGQAMPAEQRTTLAQDAASPHCKVVWMDSRRLRSALMRVATLAERERYLSAELHSELYKDIRFDLGWRVGAEEGLAPATLGIEPLLRPVFKLLRHWKLIQVLNLFGMAYVLGFRAAKMPLLLAPDICVLTCDRTVTTCFFEAGRTLQRLWLAATRAGLSVQPFAASALYGLPGYPGVAEHLQRRIAEAWQAIAGEGVPVMVLRLGHARPPLQRALRPSPDRFVSR